MKRSQIWIIVTLMSIALIGLVSFQLYWINNALKINTQRFESDVRESLSRVVSRLEQEQVAGHLKKVMEVRGDSGRFVLRTRIDANDTIRDVHFEQNLSITGNRDTVMWVDKPKVRKHRAGVLKEGIMIMTEDSAFNPDSARFRTRAEMVDLVVTQMGNEIFDFSIPGKDQIDSLLHTEFDDRGIDISYRFAVVGQKPDTVILASDAQINDFTEYEFQARLNPNDIFGNLHYLRVNFPTQSQFLFKQIWITLASSVVLLLTISFCFAYALITIIRQKKLSEIKNDFINNMTHEFKTPVATISLAAEALKEPEILSSKPTVERYVKIIDEENARLGAQVEKVLQSAQLDKGDYSLNREQVDLEQLLIHVAEQFNMKVGSVSGTVVYETHGKELLVNADKHHMLNAVNNLVDNAIKYSKGKPEVIIRVMVGPEINIMVSDKGIGMNKESVRKVFDKFYRVPTGNLHDVKGFGLGLSYVQSIVERHGGKVTAESSVGKGSTFTITLPSHD